MIIWFIDTDKKKVFLSKRLDSKVNIYLEENLTPIQVARHKVNKPQVLVATNEQKWLPIKVAM